MYSSWKSISACISLFAMAAVLSGCTGGVEDELVSSDGVGALSVTGRNLSSCSQPGTALTGFTRNGHCVDEGNDDAGSHHICIKMKPDFCTVTGQPNWCGDEMECMGKEGVCPIGNWCVCQWAFAGYIQRAGGCDAIVDIVCDATNMAALKAYRSQAANDPEIKEALQCLEKRCGLAQTVKVV